MSTKTKTNTVSVAVFDVSSTVNKRTVGVGTMFLRPVSSKRTGPRQTNYGLIRNFVEAGSKVVITPATKSEQKALTDYYNKLYA